MLTDFLKSIEILESYSQKISDLENDLMEAKGNLEQLEKAQDIKKEEILSKLLDEILDKTMLDIRKRNSRNRKECEDNIERHKEDIRKLEQEIKGKKKEVERLSTGFTKEIIWQTCHYEDGESMILRTYKDSNTRATLHDEFRKVTDSDFKSKRSVNPMTYRGTTCQNVIIKKGYRIKGRTSRETQKLNLPNNESYKRIELRFTCKKTEVDYPVKHHGPYEIMFGIKKAWDGSLPLPSASLTLTIHNIDRYEPEISQISLDIRKMEGNMAAQRGHKRREEEELSRLNLLAKKNTELVSKQIKQRIETEISEIEKKIKENEQLREEKRREQRHRSLLLLKKQEEPRFLIRLAGSLFKNKAWKKGGRKDENNVDTAETLCSDFFEFF